MTEFEIEQRDYVQSLDRGLAIIQAFGADRGAMTLSEAANLTGLTRAAARRSLLTLLHLGYVGTDKKVFWLTPKVLELGQRYLASQPWWEIAQPIVEEAARRMGESCSLCILDRTDIVYVCRVAISRLISTSLSIGSRLPAYPTALGRVLLAQLPPASLQQLLDEMTIEQLTSTTITDRKKLKARIDKARADGHCVVNQELEVGLLGLAVPVAMPNGAVTALGVSVHSARVSAREITPRYLPVLLECAERIRTGVLQRRH